VTCVVTPWESDAALPPPADRRISRLRLRVAVVGAIGIEKGYEYLLACARHVAAQRLDKFVVVGHTCDDKRLLDTGAVQITKSCPNATACGLAATGECQRSSRDPSPRLARKGSEKWAQRIRKLRCGTKKRAERIGLQPPPPAMTMRAKPRFHQGRSATAGGVNSQ
jgi:hypothetical protein